MGFSDAFKGIQYKKQVEQLGAEVEKLRELVSPDVKKAAALAAEVQSLEVLKAEKEQTIAQLQTVLSDTASRINDLCDKEKEKISQLARYDDTIALNSFGLYKPKYEMVNSQEYKDRLSQIREKQKNLIKSGSAATDCGTMSLNGSHTEGRKAIKNIQKLLLKAFNTECDELISAVKFNNVELYEDRIRSLDKEISNLGKILDITISASYTQLKIEELRLAYEYQVKKEEEKEAARQAKAELREQQKLEAEIRAAREKIEKDRKHFNRALSDIDEKIKNAGSEELSELNAKKAELIEGLSKLDVKEKDVDYREQNAKAGYVYIISNIGAFGENVYKIGMTRRLEPHERIDELGDASVPFVFDVHAMIFSEDAPKLEASLHNAFSDKKLNMINQKREFFNVTLDEIKAEVYRNYDKTVEFIDAPDAAQFRMSQKLRSIESAKKDYVNETSLAVARA